jgi:hypothetical protein
MYGILSKEDMNKRCWVSYNDVSSLTGCYAISLPNVQLQGLDGSCFSGRLLRESWRFSKNKVTHQLQGGALRCLHATTKWMQDYYHCLRTQHCIVQYLHVSCMTSETAVSKKCPAACSALQIDLLYFVLHTYLYFTVKHKVDFDNAASREIGR